MSAARRAASAQPRDPAHRSRPRRQALADRGHPDAGAVELRGLDQDAPGLRGDLALQAAHDAGERDRAGAIADQQRAGRELALRAVERGHRLAFARGADDDDRRR
jgi:hypothetical protein